MGVFRRLFKIGEAKANNMVDKLEDPILMTEQGIRDLKKDLDMSLHGLAEVKAMKIRAKNEAENYKDKANEYEKKAIALLKKAKDGNLDSNEADRLASEALMQKKNFMEKAQLAQSNHNKYEEQSNKLESQIKNLKSTIQHYENELKTLKARSRVTESTKKINRHMAQFDSNSTVSMLERMKEKVEKDEALSEAYAEMADESTSVDDEINAALQDEPNVAAADELAELKKKL